MMTLKLQIVIAIAILAILAVLVNMIRKRSLELKYALVWMMVLAALLVFWDYWRRSRKYFGGLSGDLAGWFLQRVELWMLAAVWIVEWGAHLL